MTNPTAKRPLSPHLQIYRWQMTMAMSILHRVSGAALCAGLLAVVWMLLAAASGPGPWAAFARAMGSPPGLLALFGWSVALYYHLFNGLRHLAWDCGKTLEIKSAYRTGYMVWVATALATFLTWWSAAS